MNRIPRTRLVTLMAAAAGVTAGLGAATPEQALARTPASATLASDTLPKTKAATAAAAKSKAAAPAKAGGAAKAKSAAPAKAAAAKKAEAAAKPVVSTGSSNVVSENDVCVDEADCRNINGGGY